MDPLTLGALGLGVGGGIWSNVQNLGESKRARQFAERMAGSQWQRTVIDMKNAGINPALAFGQGPNASPGGPAASVDDVVAPAVSSAIAAKRMKAELGLIDSQVRKTDEEALYVRQNIQALGTSMDESRARTNLARAQERATSLGADVRAPAARVGRVIDSGLSLAERAAARAISLMQGPRGSFRRR